MNAARLVAHYERIADALYAMQRLRRFILDLAVRGKLVPHDPGDEPASELLKRIAAEKARLVKAGAFREPSSSMQIKRDDLPFVPAPHWVWTHLIEIARPSYGFAFPSAQFNSSKRGMPLIRIRDISSTDAEAYFEGDYDPAYLVKAGDYLVGMDGEFNLRRWNGRDGLLNQRVMRINGWRCEVDAAYVRLPLQSILDHLHGETSLTTVKHLSAKQVNGIEIPLPPLAEQRRIVAKVDELMTLCDRLEAARAEREVARDRLTASSLARLSSPDAETFQDDARFVLNSLPALATRPDQIPLLRQSILNLAVRGKLVLQDPNDEPASELLKRIATQRAVLLKSGYPNAIEARAQLRKQDEQALPAELAPLPTGWEWATLQQCALIVIDCKNKTAPYTPSGIRLLRTTNVRDGKLNWVDQKFVSEQTYELWSQRSKPEPGDILITREAPMGEVAIIPEGEQVCLGQRMMLARLVRETVAVRFMLYSLRDPNLMDRVQDKPIGMTVQHLRVGGVETLLVPLPPVEEQRRIVTKVDELMGLCDGLEASLVTADDTRRRLLDALLAEALALAEPRGMRAVA
jgi:type I restriction enzyme S subunit